jgi:DNA polymerase III subunit alpha
MRSFVHLHCHSHYSLLDGASRIPELVAHTKKLGMNALALTDHGNLYGAIEFYRECKAAGLNPIVGYEAYIAAGPRTEREARRRSDSAYHLTLLARNRTGFKNLVKMASVAFLEGYHYVPRIDKELLEAHKDGLICLSGCASAEFSEFILKEDMEQATRVAEWFARVFGKNFYIEIQNNGLDIQKRCAEGAIDIANRLGLPLVATSDAHYLTQADAPAHDVLLCINTGKTRGDANRMRYGSDLFYVRAPEEMYRLFPGYEAAVQRSQEIADGVAIELDFKARHFPVFTPPGGKAPEQYLRELCEIGLRERYGDNPSQAARDRLEHELNIICRMGFASYFLIVGDFVRFAAENGIPASARGSACGAVVSYVLKLSHVDPLEYDLLFERFLDPNRNEAPDIDIDFCQDRREEVIAYVRQKYGEGSVAQIATFGTMAAKAAIKDVGRALDVPLDRVNQLTALVPKTLGITLDEALQQEPELKKEYDTDPQVRELIDIARTLEGTNRQAGIHAAGVVIANGPLTEYVPLHRAMRKGDDTGNKSGEAVVATQWVMGDLEKVGLLKMDFLGLRTLTLLDNAVKLIQRTRGETIDLYKLPLDDRKTYELLQRGDAKGVFQLESDGIRELLKRMKPDNIRDIIAIMALYRPGPLGGGMVDAYVNRKHGRERPTYPHPEMEEILSETYAVMVYQEQIMRILNRLGGIELSSAYACIKAISKKKQEIIDERRAEFIKGARERGLAKEIAEEIFGLIVYFGGYGFNKCVVGTTTLVDAVTGERTTVADLFKHRRSFTVHSLDGAGRLRARAVTDVVWNGKKPVFELQTVLGHRITATGNHPFRTLDGWKNLADLRPGDRIAAPRRLPIAAGESWPRHELITLAGLLSEGNTCHPTSFYFYGNDPVLVMDFADAVRCFPDTVARIDRRREVRLEVCVNTGRDGSIRKAIRLRQREAAAALGETVTAVKPPPPRSGAFRWAERLGLLGREATDKRIPLEVFRLCDTDLELFLGRLWAGDGFLANLKVAIPFYATSSPWLARDVQTLLLRLGIVSRIHAKVFKYKGETRPGYTVNLLGESSIETFVTRVAPHCLGREKAVAYLEEYLQTTRRGQTSKDTVPAEVRRWVDEERRQAGLTWVELEQRSGVSMKEFLGNGSAAKRGFRRHTLARLASFFGSQRLAEASTSDIFWDRIISIEPKGVQDTYDLTVDVDHNFVADGLIIHNSHSAAYAQIGYQTAYLKAHYTPEFMAALLSSEIEDGNKRDIMVDHIGDARHLGVEVLPPDVNTCEPDFTVKDGKILFGLTAIKGLGRGAAGDIVRARQEGGPFKDFFDFCERIDSHVVSRAAIEKMIKAGAFDAFGRRAQLWAVLPHAIQAASELQEDRRRGQRNLFDAFGEEGPAPAAPAVQLPDLPEWPEKERLLNEKEALDFYLSSHPLAQHEDDIRRFATHTVSQMPELTHGQEVFMGGMLTGVRFMNSKNARNGNSRYVMCQIEDFTGSTKCVMWPDDLARHKDEVHPDRICFIKATVNKNRPDAVLVMSRILSIEQAQRELTKGLWLQMSLGAHEPPVVDAVARVLQRSPGSCPVFLCFRDGAGKKTLCKASEDFKINPATVAVGELELLLGAGSVKFAGSMSPGARNGG